MTEFVADHLQCVKVHPEFGAFYVPSQETEVYFNDSDRETVLQVSEMSEPTDDLRDQLIKRFEIFEKLYFYALTAGYAISYVQINLALKGLTRASDFTIGTQFTVTAQSMFMNKLSAEDTSYTARKSKGVELNQWIAYLRGAAIAIYGWKFETALISFDTETWSPYFEEDLSPSEAYHRGMIDV